MLRRLLAHWATARTVDRNAPRTARGSDGLYPLKGPAVSAGSERPKRLLTRGSLAETTRVTEILRKETVGGALLLAGTVIALVWINSPLGESYIALRDYEVGP